MMPLRNYFHWNPDIFYCQETRDQMLLLLLLFSCVGKEFWGVIGTAFLRYMNYSSQTYDLYAQDSLYFCLDIMDQDCLLCPTGFAANMALMVAIGDISLLLAAGSKPQEEDKIAIFSDALNHASIIDGIRLAERQRGVKVFVYRHCDMSHLNELL